MAMRLQRRASRKNAKRSTGPQTTEGKARSSQNARKHGLFARDTLLPGDDPQEFLQLIADLEQELEAGSGFERRLMRHIADTEWRMRRLVRLETGALTSQLEKERLYAQRLQAELGKLNQSLQPEHAGQNQTVQTGLGDESASPSANPYQQTTKGLGAVVAADRDTPVLLTLSLYESRLSRKYFSLLKQLRFTQKLRRAAEALERHRLPDETEVLPPATESAQAPPPTPATELTSPQGPTIALAQQPNPSTPSTDRANPQETEERQAERPPSTVA